MKDIIEIRRKNTYVFVNLYCTKISSPKLPFITSFYYYYNHHHHHLYYYLLDIITTESGIV